MGDQPYGRGAPIGPPHRGADAAKMVPECPTEGAPMRSFAVTPVHVLAPGMVRDKEVPLQEGGDVGVWVRLWARRPRLIHRVSDQPRQVRNGRMGRGAIQPLVMLGWSENRPKRVAKAVVVTARLGMAADPPLALLERLGPAKCRCNSQKGPPDVPRRLADQRPLGRHVPRLDSQCPHQDKGQRGSRSSGLTWSTALEIRPTCGIGSSSILPAPTVIEAPPPCPRARCRRGSSRFRRPATQSVGR